MIFIPFRIWSGVNSLPLWTKKADPEGSAFLNHLSVDPSAGIIQVRFSGSMTARSPSQLGSSQLPATLWKVIQQKYRIGSEGSQGKDSLYLFG